jgi:GDP/UDP-N,N'-diacetylbacillosamine 2-epimerase (hydrolysing)
MPAPLNVAVLTTARSDFGLLKRVIRLLAERFNVDLLVAGSHYLTSRGRTLNEIEQEFGKSQGVNIVALEAMADSNTASDHVATLAGTQLLASRWFAANPCDLLLFLGDRWELWGVTIPAFMHGIPLAHISGGEVTEGAIDDSVRHAHTKIASLHFAATEAFARNISLMGEEDWRISVVGECGLDQIHDAEIASAETMKSRFDVDLTLETLLVAFHPSTLDFETPVSAQIGALIQGLEAFTNRQLVFTAPGVEQGSQEVLAAIHSFVERHPAARFVDHFGSRNYLAVMRAAKVVVGNSSSGLVEASSFGVPAVNVGQRQKNRMAADSVQHVGYDPGAIRAAVERALTPEFQRFSRTCPNPYDPYKDGKNSERIVTAIVHAVKRLPRERLRVKKFDTNVRSEQWNYLLNGENAA